MTIQQNENINNSNNKKENIKSACFKLQNFLREIIENNFKKNSFNYYTINLDPLLFSSRIVLNPFTKKLQFLIKPKSKVNKSYL